MGEGPAVSAEEGPALAACLKCELCGKVESRNYYEALPFP